MTGTGAGRVTTVGQGTLTAEAFVALVTGAGIEAVVDIRSYPGSRRHPQFGREAMAGWLPDAGVAYEWEPRLGGRRRSVEHRPSPEARVDDGSLVYDLGVLLG